MKLIFIVIFVIFIAGCTSPPPSQESILRKAETQIEMKRTEEIEASKETERRRLLSEEKSTLTKLLEQARAASIVTCVTTAICDKVFSLTKVFIIQNSDMKIQLMDSTLVESFNPTENGKISIRAYKVPGKGDMASIHISISCKELPSKYVDCLSKEIFIFKKFKTFINVALQE